MSKCLSSQSVCFFLLGYYGFGNWGDELSLFASIETLLKISKKIGLPFSIEVLYASSSPYVLLPEGVRVIERREWREIFKALRRADFVVVAGGNLLQDRTSFRSLAYYLFLLRLALCWRKKVIFYGCGLGPLRLALSRMLVDSLLPKLSLFIARDVETFGYLASFGKLKGVVALGGDPVLYWSGCFPSRDSSFERVAFFLRPESLALERVVSELRAFTRLTGEKIELVAFHKERDGKFLATIAERVGGYYRFFSTPQEIWDYFSSLKMLFSMRLHPLIIATLAGVPCFGFNIDPKIAGFSKSLGLGNLLSLEDFEANRLYECWQKAFLLEERILELQKSLLESYCKTEKILEQYLVEELKEWR